jgi:hypothetical protein
MEDRFPVAPYIARYCAQLESLFAERERPANLVYWGVEGITATHGVSFPAVSWKRFRGRGYRRGREKNCFSNAYQLAFAFDDLIYCEGLAFSGLIPVHHAWCVDSDGNVVDATWREERFRELPVEQWEYVGVPFASDWVWKTAGRRKIYGILDEPQLYRTELPPAAIAERYRSLAVAR